MAQATAWYMQRKWNNATAFIIVIWYFPNLLGGILEIALPWSNKPGLLGALFMCNTFGVAYANSLVWASNTCAGHTKRVTQTQMFMFAYGISNIISPQLWQALCKPRYYVSWAIQIAVSLSKPVRESRHCSADRIVFVMVSLAGLPPRPRSS